MLALFIYNTYITTAERKKAQIQLWQDFNATSKIPACQQTIIITLQYYTNLYCILKKHFQIFGTILCNIIFFIDNTVGFKQSS